MSEPWIYKPVFNLQLAYELTILPLAIRHSLSTGAHKTVPEGLAVLLSEGRVRSWGEGGASFVQVQPQLVGIQAPGESQDGSARE